MSGQKRSRYWLSGAKGGFTLHLDILESILLADDVIDKPVVVISVAGAFRRGKSFLMDMMLRYLTAADKSNWVNEPSTRGFPWQSGFRRHTTGILIWSEPFPVVLPNGDEAVIVLMDTQGTFDNKSTVHESSTVFALSTLLSSLQIFNLTGNMQNDDLQHLQLFTEYGKMTLDDISTKPFQKLLFLVRDWQFTNDLPLGAEGGDRLVAETLQTQSGEQELAGVRNHIKDFFREINGFLLPHPGKKVASSSKFDCSSSDMDPTFVEGLKELMPKNFAPENLIIKCIASNPIKAGDMYTFLITYVKMFESDELPKPKNIMQATAEANNMAAMQEAKSQYIREMECLLRGNKPSLAQDQLFRKHSEATGRAQKTFNDRKKMGDWKMLDEYRTKLLQEMEEWYTFAEHANNIKREAEKLDAQKHNGELARLCKMMYISDMEPVTVETAAYFPQKNMISAHDVAKQKAMHQFDAEKQVCDGAELLGRSELSQDIEVEVRKMLFHNDVKKDAKNQRMAQVNMTAVGKAKKSYQSKMNVMTAGATLTVEALQQGHQQALRAASDIFDELKEGDELITVGYSENMKNDIDREMDTYARINQHNIEMNKVQTKIQALEAELNKAKKPGGSAKKKKGCTIQ